MSSSRLISVVVVDAVDKGIAETVWASGECLGDPECTLVSKALSSRPDSVEEYDEL